MGSKLFVILAILVLGVFFALMLFSREDKNKLFIRYILLAYPLMALDLLPSFISFTSFDFLTLFYFFVFYRPRKVTIEWGRLYLGLFIIIIGIATIGAYYAESLTKDTTTAFIEVFTVFIFAKILTDECIEDPSFFYTIVSCLKITLVVSLAFLICQFIFGVGFSIAKSQNINVLGAATRYTSFFQDPQKYAQYLAACSFLFLIKDKDQEKIPYYNYLLILGCLVAILFTGGRAGFGGWCLGIVIMLLFGKSSYRFAAILTAIGLYVVVYNFQDSFAIFKRASLEDSYDFRFNIWRDAFRIFLDHVYFGIGIGNYANYVSFHNPDQFWEADKEIIYFDHPESGYLKFLTEYGAIGFAAICSFVLIPAVQGFRNFFRSRNAHIILLIAGVASWMVGFYTVYSFGDMRIKILVVTIVSLIISSNTWGELEDAE